MKLWVLKPVKGLIFPHNPWVPPYDKAHKLVIRAATCGAARAMASAVSFDEGPECWLNKAMSSCEELKQDNETPGIIIQDVREG